MNTTFEIPHSYEFKRRVDWPVDIGIAAGCILGYVSAWIGLICIFQLTHWMVGVSGAIVGGFIGWIWFRLMVRNRSHGE